MISPHEQEIQQRENMTKTHEQEIQQGERFQFGQNWKHFLSVLNDERVAQAEQSLKEMLEIETLQGKSFLDIGSGSGLFSLAARRLGARVHSFDYDPQSVGCTQELKQRYFPDDSNWIIEEGSILDLACIEKLNNFDIVYSWGVLHHTGNLWQALENVCLPVVQGGQLFIAIYNDQGIESNFWKRVKKIYCSSLLGKSFILAIFIPYFLMGGFVSDLLKRDNPLNRYKKNIESRGMALLYDWNDWLGGYPFEVAKPEEIFLFFRNKGFELKNLKTCGGRLGNNQFIFVKR